MKQELKSSEVNMMFNNTSMLDAALFYASKGLAVFPLHHKIADGMCSCNDPDCKSIGKHPRIKNGLTAATTDENIIQYWLKAFPNCNLGLVTGARSGIFAIDVDTKQDGLRAWETFKDDHMLDDYNTPVQRTQNGGMHIFYKMPEGQKVTTRTNVLAKGIDVRGDGGYVVIAPSVGYAFVADQGIGDIDFEEADQAILDLVVKPEFEEKAEFKAPIEGLLNLDTGLIEKIESALAVLDTDDHDTWRNVGFALHDSNGKQAFQLWCNWSQQSEKYDHQRQVQFWNDCDSRRGQTANNIELEYIFKLATDTKNWSYEEDLSDVDFASFNTCNLKSVTQVSSNQPFQLPKEFIERRPLPIKTKLLPVKPFDCEMLPAPYIDFAKDVAERMDNTSPDYVGVALMTLTAGLVGARVAVQPKEFDSGWTETPTLWAAAVGKPSAKKTPAMSAVLALLNPIQKKFHDEYAAEVRVYDAEIKLNKLEEKAAEAKAKKVIFDINSKLSRNEKLELLAEPETKEALIKPQFRNVVINDCTAEALALRLENNPYGVLQYRDELTAWLSSMTAQDRAHERAFFLECFSAKNIPYSQERITRDNVKLERTVLSVMGSIQPSKLLPHLNSRRKGSTDDGLLERIQLAVYPDNLGTKRVDKSPDKVAKSQAQEALNKIAEIPDPEDGKQLVFKFSPEAQQAYNHQYELLHSEAESADESWQAVIGKHATLLAKLALLTNLIEAPESREISVSSLKKAIWWLGYLQSHAQRIYALTDDNIESATSLLGKIDNLSNPFQMSDFTRNGWKGLKSSEDRRLALELLVRHGYLHEITVTPKGLKPYKAYYKHPSLIDEF
ncbi:DUF3987 domain-containing protein [Pseudoalteromonas sp. T1lg48]|uniref:DUF3987 domain-containing protein n=1 Tax=Pseudoalteromonas sp. T1lg48 TaxID=2077100 RepID=UPI000CF6482C|nr:DUF3987 domain-containing protein [Pseudoalteromonas sp. T1lg48]